MRHLLFFLLPIIFSCGDLKTSPNKGTEDSVISYFSTESEAYIHTDLYAKFRDSVYVLIDSASENCVHIEYTGDFNKDGYKDVLVEFINGCGGNCCGNSYMIYFYNGKTFSHSDLVGYDWDGIRIDSSNKTYTFEIEEVMEGYNTDLTPPKTSTYQLTANKLICLKTIQPTLIEAKIEIRSSDLKDGDTLSYLLVDLNANEKGDTICCYPYERWGRMFWEIHFDDGTIFKEEAQDQVKRIGVLSSTHNGYSDIVVDFDQTLVWDDGRYK